MTDPLAKYVYGNGMMQYYDVDALAADLRRMLLVVEAAIAENDAMERLARSIARHGNGLRPEVREASNAHLRAQEAYRAAVRRYRAADHE